MELNRYAIKEFLSNINNFDMIFELISVINSYDGSFPEIEYFYNDQEFFDIFFGTNTMEAVTAVSLGNYELYDDFVKFDSRGNLETANKYEVMNEYDFYREEIIDKLIDVADECDIYIDFPEEFYIN